MMSKPKGKEGPWKADKVREASNGRFVKMQTGVGASKKSKKLADIIHGSHLSRIG